MEGFMVQQEWAILEERLLLLFTPYYPLDIGNLLNYVKETVGVKIQKLLSRLSAKKEILVMEMKLYFKVAFGLQNGGLDKSLMRKNGALTLN